MLLQEDVKKRKIRTESGVWIPATYKTDRYERWKGKSKIDQNDPASEDSGDDEKGGNRNVSSRFGGGFPRRGVPMGMNLEGTFQLIFNRSIPQMFTVRLDLTLIHLSFHLQAN